MLSGNAEVVELLEQLTDHIVVLSHAVGLDTLARSAEGLGFEVRAHVHARGVEPYKERSVSLC